jgi:hypothetical protein
MKTRKRTRKSNAQKRDKTLIFRVNKAEYEQFGAEAKRRQMQKAELLRHLMSLYFVERIGRNVNPLSRRK